MKVAPVLAIAVAILASPRSARGEGDGEAAPAPDPVLAVETARRSRFELAGVAGYVSPPIRGGTTPFGAGFGGRVGLALPHLYLGARLTGFLGGTDIDVTERSILYGGEAGYSVRLATSGDAYFVLRPQIGFGGASIIRTDPSLLATSTSTPSVGRSGRTRPNVDVVSAASVSSGGGGGGASGTSDTTTANGLYVEPAFSAMWVSGSTFVGLLGSVLVLPSITYGGTEPSTWLAYGLAAQVGLSL
jgi:hypothetical protein